MLDRGIVCSEAESCLSHNIYHDVDASIKMFGRKLQALGVSLYGYIGAASAVALQHLESKSKRWAGVAFPGQTSERIEVRRVLLVSPSDIPAEFVPLPPDLVP